MNPKAKPFALVLALSGSLALSLPVAQAANPGNPGTPKTKNPCAASDRIDPTLVTRPKNYKPYVGKTAELKKEGKRLWTDTSLSTNGMSCNTCHQANSAFQDSFAQPYPHRVQMASDRAAMKTLHLDEMVQICMVAPMATKPLPWDSKQLAALTAYSAEVQKTFKPPQGKIGTPCAAQNPCAAKNPCAGKNPCAAKK